MFSLFKKKKKSLKKQNRPIIKNDYSNAEIISEYFHKETGITFEKQMSVLQNKLSSFCKIREIHSFNTLLQKIKVDEVLKQELVDYLTINETFFYREFKQIEKLLSMVKEHDKPVKILCAPSATGEEPYSIAIALLQSGVQESAFKIVGIDINSQAIQTAKEAVYSKGNVRNLSSEILVKYFNVSQEEYQLREKIKALVTFKVHNIFDESFSEIGKFDFIFSRNMLIYFDKKTKLKAKEILESLRKDKSVDVFFGHADLF